MRFDQETFSKVASVKVNETKPIIVDTMDNGENAVWDTVTPIAYSCVVLVTRGPYEQANLV